MISKGKGGAVCLTHFAIVTPSFEEQKAANASIEFLALQVVQSAISPLRKKAGRGSQSTFEAHYPKVTNCKHQGENGLSSEEQQPASSASAGRPSLGGAPGAKSEQHSILASVQGSGRREPSAGARRRWPWLSIAMLAVVAAGYFVSSMPSLHSPDAASQSSAQQRDHLRAPSPAAPPESTAPTSAHAAGATPAHAPARIETVAASEAAAPLSGADDPFARLNAAAPPQPEGLEPAAPLMAAALPGARADAAGAAPKREEPAAEHVDAAKPVAPRAGVAKKRPAPQRAAAQASSGDADVDLLAALMAHVSRDGVSAASFQVPPAAHGDSAQTIAALVRSCNALASAAAAQCRQRICEGYWGKAEACPAKTRRPR